MKPMASAPLSDEDLSAALAALRGGAVWETGNDEDWWRYSWSGGKYRVVYSNRGHEQSREVSEADVANQMKICATEIRYFLADRRG